MKNFRALGSPLGAVSLTYRNLPLVVIILLSLVAPLHTPIIELTENFLALLVNSFPWESVGPKISLFLSSRNQLNEKFR